MKTKYLLSLLAVASVSTLTGCLSSSTSNLDGVLILQAYGTGGKDECALSHSFVELYNTTNSTITLDSSSLHYSEGTNVWEKFNLEGSIAPNTSFLITFDECVDAVNNIETGDLNFDYTINNKGIKFCLMNNQEDLVYINPYTSNASGYIDMVCATDSTGEIDAAEGNYVTGQSKQKSVRRIDLEDTNDNETDFEIIDYSTLSTNSITQYSPKNQAYGVHDAIVIPSVEQTDNTLLIYQVYGNSCKDESAINRSFIELYNNSNNDINLTGYSIQYMSESESTWSVIILEGTIKAYSSYLIVGNESSDGGVYGNIDDSSADMVVDFTLSNDGYAVCLLSTITSLETINPFETELESYIDMVGCNISYYENTAVDKPSKQKGIVRTSLDDTNNNANDFEIVDYRTEGVWEKYSPKSSGYGQWIPFS